jgi:hypothetical protein
LQPYYGIDHDKIKQCHYSTAKEGMERLQAIWDEGKDKTHVFYKVLHREFSKRVVQVETQGKPQEQAEVGSDGEGEGTRDSEAESENESEYDGKGKGKAKAKVTR